MREFFAAPCGAPKVKEADGEGGWTNGAIVSLVCGVRGPDVRDAALFDAVRIRYDQPVSTFREAFRLCAQPYSRSGHRDWRDFDLATLRECHPAFEAFLFPEWVEEMLADDALEAFASAADFGDLDREWQTPTIGENDERYGRR